MPLEPLELAAMREPNQPGAHNLAAVEGSGQAAGPTYSPASNHGATVCLSRGACAPGRIADFRSDRGRSGDVTPELSANGRTVNSLRVYPVPHGESGHSAAHDPRHQKHPRLGDRPRP